MVWPFITSDKIPFMETKTCCRCHHEKLLNEFPSQLKRGKRIITGACLDCVKVQRRESYLRHHESRKARNRAAHAANRQERNARSSTYHTEHREEATLYYQNNRTKILEADWRRRIKRLYGVTVEDYQRMLALQEGKCALCKTEQPWTRSGRFAIDHDHATGRVRALLCHNCNKGIGNLKDDPELLRNAANYIETYRHPLMAVAA
jgi:hypothetical protein